MRALFQGLVAVLASGMLLAGLLFGAAGRWDLPLVWAYFAGYLAVGLVNTLLLSWRSPDLLRRRSGFRIGPGDVPDRLYRAALALGWPAHYVLAGLDLGRFHWSGEIPVPVQLAGLVGYLAGNGFATWAAVSNPFFTPEVRLQPERGQQVITAGPYRFVRHPGYAGGILFMLLSGVALGSWWAILPMLLVVATLLRRTALEDRLLRRNLPGYGEYARRVRFRLIPGIW